MGALLSVAQGGPEPPRVMVVTYTPPNLKPGAPVIGLIGKAVTFDTGGISLKTSDGMEKMKKDMGGGAPTLGGVRAPPRRQPKQKTILLCANPDKKYPRSPPQPP